MKWIAVIECWYFQIIKSDYQLYKLAWMVPQPVAIKAVIKLNYINLNFIHEQLFEFRLCDATLSPHTEQRLWVAKHLCCRKWKRKPTFLSFQDTLHLHGGVLTPVERRTHENMKCRSGSAAKKYSSKLQVKFSFDCNTKKFMCHFRKMYLKHQK